MARFKFKKSDFFFLAVILAMFAYRLPGILEHFRTEGTTHAPVERSVLGRETTVSYPPAGPAVTIYWATWCAPCKLEMSRLRASVEAGKIPRDRIFAISQGEGAGVLKKFLSENSYPFVFLLAHPQDEAFKISATPTLILWQDRKVLSMSAGLSLWGIWRTENLF